MTGAGLRRGRQSFGAVSRRTRRRQRRARRCSPASRARGRCWSKSRRWWRRRRSARRAARWSAGMPSRLAMVLAVLEAHGGLKLGQHRRLPQRRRRPAHRRAGRRSGGGGGARLVARRRQRCRTTASISARLRFPAPCAPVGHSESSAQGSRQARLHPRVRAAAAAKDGEGARLASTPIASVASLVAEIAAAGVSQGDEETA